MFSDMLRRGRERWGLRLARASWLFGVSVPELRELEAGSRWPDFDIYDRIAKLFGWFIDSRGRTGSSIFRESGPWP